MTETTEITNQREETRCAVCGWPLAESAEKGCVRGNCSMRPIDWTNIYDVDRANREYGTNAFQHSPQQRSSERAAALEALWSATKADWPGGYSKDFTAAVQRLKKLEEEQ